MQSLQAPLHDSFEEIRQGLQQAQRNSAAKSAKSKQSSAVRIWSAKPEVLDKAFVKMRRQTFTRPLREDEQLSRFKGQGLITRQLSPTARKFISPANNKAGQTSFGFVFSKDGTTACSRPTTAKESINVIIRPITHNESTKPSMLSAQSKSKQALIQDTFASFENTQEMSAIDLNSQEGLERMIDPYSCIRSNKVKKAINLGTDKAHIFDLRIGHFDTSTSQIKDKKHSVATNLLKNGNQSTIQISDDQRRKFVVIKTDLNSEQLQLALPHELKWLPIITKQEKVPANKFVLTSNEKPKRPLYRKQLQNNSMLTTRTDNGMECQHHNETNDTLHEQSEVTEVAKEKGNIELCKTCVKQMAVNNGSQANVYNLYRPEGLQVQPSNSKSKMRYSVVTKPVKGNIFERKKLSIDSRFDYAFNCLQKGKQQILFFNPSSYCTPSNRSSRPSTSQRARSCVLARQKQEVCVRQQRVSERELFSIFERSSGAPSNIPLSKPRRAKRRSSEDKTPAAKSAAKSLASAMKHLL